MNTVIRLLSLLLLLVALTTAVAQGGSPRLREGIYRSGPGGFTYEIRAVGDSSMTVRQWQTATPAPPDDRANYFNSGTATLLADGVTWRTNSADVSGYCCGNRLQFEFRVLTANSFQGIRWRYWPNNSPAPGPNDLWMPTGSEVFVLVGSSAAKPSSSEPPKFPAPPPEGRPDLKDSGARFSSINGEVQIYHDGESPSQAHFVKLNTVIYTTDHIITSEESEAIIGFSDLSTFLVKPETEIVVTTPPEKDSKIKLVAGNIWANVKKMLKDGTMEVEMSQAVTGIKGTRLILEEKAGTSTTKVIEGSVVVTSKRTGRSVMLKAGQMVRATARGLDAVKMFEPTSEEANWR